MGVRGVRTAGGGVQRSECFDIGCRLTLLTSTVGSQLQLAWPTVCCARGNGVEARKRNPLGVVLRREPRGGAGASVAGQDALEDGTTEDDGAAAKGGRCGGWAGSPKQRKVNQRQVDLQESLLGAARRQSDWAGARTDEVMINVMVGCYTNESSRPLSYPVTLWFAAGNNRARSSTR